MISASADYLAALRHSHEAVIRVTAYEGGVEVGDLNVVDLALDIDGSNNVQRSADITVAVDPLKTESRDTLESITTGKGSVVITHSIKYGEIVVGSPVVLATLRVDEMEWGLSKATRTLRCYDRTLLLQEYGLPTARPLNDTYVNLISTLVGETISGETVTVDPSIDTALTPSPGKSFNRGSDRLAKIQELADAVGAWLICEPDGSFSLKPAPGTDATLDQEVQWAFSQGTDGVLVDATSVFSRREQYNAIGLEFTPADDAGEWSGYIFLWDNDPTSPTYFDGDFGRKPIYFVEEYDHLPSVSEAEKVARRKLYEHSGLTRAISVESIYNPLLLPGDKVTIDVPSPAGGFSAETHFIDRVSLRFGRAAMKLDTRLSRQPGSFGSTINNVPFSNVNTAALALSGDATGGVV